MKKITLLILGLALISSWPTGALAEDFIVLSSTTPEFKVGGVVPSGTKVELAPRKRLVLVNAAGRTLKLTGPYSDTPGGAPGKGASNVMAALASLVRTTQEDARSVGAVRAAGISTERQAMMVNVSETGDYCGYEGAARELTRYKFEKGATVTITAVEDAKAETLEWDRNNPFLPWPKSIPIQDGATYLVGQDGKDSRTMIIMHQLGEKKENPVETVLEMGTKGCLEQVKMLLALMRKSAT